MRSFRSSRPWWIACAALLWLPPPSALAAPSEATPLFSTSEIRTMEIPSDRAVRTARIGRVASNVLDNDRLRLDLPDGRRYVAERAPGQHDSRVWTGTIDGLERAAVWLTFEHAGIVGLVHVGRESYEITPFWTGEALLYGAGSEGRPPYADLADRVHFSEQRGTVQRRWATLDRGSRGVIAWYTPAARTHWADFGGIEARIVTAVSSLNGQAGAPWMLDEIREVAYTESGDARDALRWLQQYLSGSTASATAADVASLRAVLLITEDNNLCGVTAQPQALRTRRVDLHVIYSNCLSDPALASQLNGSANAERQAFAEKSSDHAVR
jgi:hypothetical protein